jgi:type 1 glutamine amidotransferase
MPKQPLALILQGGWSGHHPEAIAHLFAEQLQGHNFTVTIADSLSVLEDSDYLHSLQLIVPNWTMGTLSSKQSKNLRDAVANGVGLGGCHGGMGDAFRGDIDYEWMVGGHFVGHPHVGKYVVRKTATPHPVTTPLRASFEYDSEQYYMMVDPSIDVLADTLYQYDNKEVTMPVIWTKHHGKGRVFYSALGHQPEEFERYPDVLDMTTRGLLWAARIL